MSNFKGITVGVIVGAIFLYLGFMVRMSYERYVAAQDPVFDIKSIDQFKAELHRLQLPLLIFFYSRKATDSLKQLPLVERAAQDYHGRVKFVKVSGDNLPDIPLAMGINRVPAMAMVNPKTRLILISQGFIDLPELKKLIDTGSADTPPAQPNPQAPAQPNPQAGK